MTETFIFTTNKKPYSKIPGLKLQNWPLMLPAWMCQWVQQLNQMFSGGDLRPPMGVLKEFENISFCGVFLSLSFVFESGSFCIACVQSSRRMLRTNRAFGFHQLLSHIVCFSPSQASFHLAKIYQKKTTACSAINNFSSFWNSFLNKKFFGRYSKNLTWLSESGKGAAQWWS